MKTGATLVQTAPRWYSDTFGGQDINTQDRVQSYWHFVTCDPLVKGNRKTPNPWSYTVDRRTGLHGTYIYDLTNGQLGSQTYTGQLTEQTQIVFWPNEGSFWNQVRGIALERLNEKVRGSLDLATSLAEAGQTAKMLNLVGRFKAGVTDMRRSYDREVRGLLRATRNRRALTKALRRWQNGLKSRHPGAYQPVPTDSGIVSRVSSLGANGWCEFTYGWKPLISDIYGIAENVTGHVRNNDKIKVAVTRQINETRTQTITYLGYSAPHQVRYTGFCKAEYGIRLKPNWDQGLAKWSSLNPLSVAWELTPYSFVIDWFLDIGSYIRGLETALLYDNLFRDGYLSTLIKWEASVDALGTIMNPSPNRYTLRATSAYSRTAFRRTVLTSYPTPRLPSFQVELGSSRLISAAALLRQLLR